MPYPSPNISDIVLVMGHARYPLHVVVKITIASDAYRIQFDLVGKEEGKQMGGYNHKYLLIYVERSENLAKMERNITNSPKGNLCILCSYKIRNSNSSYLRRDCINSSLITRDIT